MVSKESSVRGSARAASRDPSLEDRDGFTIVEVIISVVILAVGLLGMAGATLLVVQQTNLADATADRSLAVQTAIEGLRAVPFDDVAAGSDSVGVFDVSWTVTSGDRWKQVEIVTVGPGSVASRGFPMLHPSVHDTFSYRIILQ
jgi:prepilin-type N-terminal cleavage/methylation domain-containing protein